jgi:predicted RecB family nuclease
LSGRDLLLQPTQIKGEVFARFLRCELEADLHSRGVVGADREFRSWEHRCRNEYKQAALIALQSLHQDDQVHIGIPAPSSLKKKRWRLIIDCVAESPELHACLDAVELAAAAEGTGSSSYRPIRFVPGEKLTSSDKLLLGFDAVALSRITGNVPTAGCIVHGSRHTKTKVPLAKPIREVRAALAKIAALGSRTAPPPAVLNKHCGECEFRSRCRADLVEKDDLSLLATLNARERKAWNEKGIFTVTQLSYAFRPRKRSAREHQRPLKHEPALKALAIRNDQIHVVGAPNGARSIILFISTSKECPIASFTTSLDCAIKSVTAFCIARSGPTISWTSATCGRRACALLQRSITRALFTTAVTKRCFSDG